MKQYEMNQTRDFVRKRNEKNREIKHYEGNQKRKNETEVYDKIQYGDRTTTNFKKTMKNGQKLPKNHKNKQKNHISWCYINGVPKNIHTLGHLPYNIKINQKFLHGIINGSTQE